MTDNMRPINSVAGVTNVARLAQLMVLCRDRSFGVPGMACFHGRAGLGKSSACTYATIKFDAVHVEALPLGGVKGLLSMIVHECGLKPKSTEVALMYQAFEWFGKTGRPLIVDEADKILKEKCVEVLRAIHDRTGVPVILVGEENLPQKLAAWERVQSRLLQSVGAEPATLDDVRQMAVIYAAPVAMAADMVAAVASVSNGSLRNAVTNFAAVKEWAVKQGLEAVSLADWGDQPFKTGEAPIPRHLALRGLRMRRGAAA